VNIYIMSQSKTVMKNVTRMWQLSCFRYLLDNYENFYYRSYHN